MRHHDLEHQTSLNLGRDFFALDVGEDSQTEVYSPARTATGYDIAVSDHSILHIFGSLRSQCLFETIVAGHLSAFQVREKTQNNAWCSADCGYCTAFPDALGLPFLSLLTIPKKMA